MTNLPTRTTRFIPYEPDVDRFPYLCDDDHPDEDWLILIYIKNNSPDEGIIIEDKTDPSKSLSNEFKTNEIFKASDMMVDSLTNLLDKEREKRKSN